VLSLAVLVIDRGIARQVRLGNIIDFHRRPQPLITRVSTERLE
jgi:hypothetical protein